MVLILKPLIRQNIANPTMIPANNDRIVPLLQSKQMVVTKIGNTEINIANIMSPPYIFSFYCNLIIDINHKLNM